MILETPPPRKGTSFLRSKCDHEPTFCGVVFQCFFECLFFLILCDLGCPGTPFWETLCITFPAEPRKGKSVFGLRRRVRIAYPAFRKMHFSATFSILVFGALRGKQFWLDFGVFGTPTDSILEAGVVQKCVLKKRCKKCSKTGARVARVTGCGPLKNRQNHTIRPPDTDPNTPWRAWRHGGGYIYIYIYIDIDNLYIYI